MSAGLRDPAQRRVRDVALLALVAEQRRDPRSPHDPGATAFDPDARRTELDRAVRTSDISPALAAPYAEWRGADVIPDTDATNTIAPPWSRMARAAVLHGEERVAQHDVEVPVPARRRSGRPGCRSAPCR